MSIDEVTLGKNILKKHKSIKGQLDSAKRINSEEFLKRIGIIKIYTGSEDIAVACAEASLKFRNYHKNGGVNAAQNIAYQLALIAEYTKSKDSVITSAKVIIHNSSPKKAGEIADNLGSIAIDYLSTARTFGGIFDNLASEKYLAYKMNRKSND